MGDASAVCSRCGGSAGGLREYVASADFADRAAWVFVRPLAACASDPVGKAAVAPLVAAVATPLLNNLFGGLIGVLVAALQSAAAADKNRLNVTTNSVMFFTDV